MPAPELFAEVSPPPEFKLGDRPEPDVPEDDPRWQAYIDKCEARQAAYLAGKDESESSSGFRVEDVDWPALL